MTNTSVFEPLVRLKAMREPSGENTGSRSTSGVDVRRRAGPPVRGTAHKSPAYANATRSRLTAGCRSSLVPAVALRWVAAELTKTIPRAAVIANSRRKRAGPFGDPLRPPAAPRLHAIFLTRRI